MSVFQEFRTKMEATSVSEAAILAFQRNYEALVRQETGVIAEDEIEPAPSLIKLSEIADPMETFDPNLLAQTVVIKLNGGLGTSMGLQKAKSLLPVKEGVTFLDVIAQQIIYLREHTGATMEFLLMNSFSTSGDTLEHLKQYHEHGLERAENVEMLQNRIPKIDAETLTPAQYPENPSLEWCPPGHGDLYTALAGSGWLDRLLEAGVKYVFVSNSDNLGAILDPSLLKYFAEENIPFLMETTRRTEADKKGGHLALRQRDGQLLLREVAQTSPEDLDTFQDIETHRYFNTNSLWIRLDVLKQTLESCAGVLPLPMIKNEKTLNPRDKSSTPVYQLETAMGAAIECFPGARAIEVPRSRFAPVKTSADLLALRSDAYEQTESGSIRLIESRGGKPPMIHLSDEYKLVDSLASLGQPSLAAAQQLRVQGPVRFSQNVVIEGKVSFLNTSGETKWIASGHYKDEEIEL